MYVEGFQTLREGNLYGFRSYDGHIVIAPKYKYVGTFSAGYCHVWADDTLAGLIDTTGREIIPPLYPFVGDPSENRILYAHHGLYGYTNLNGDIIVPPTFPIAGPFSNGRAPVAVATDTSILYTFIDTLGNLIFPPRYHNVMPFVDGVAPVSLFGQWGLIGLDGEEILPATFGMINTPGHGILFAGNGDGMALYKIAGSRQQVADSPYQLPATSYQLITQLTPPVYLPCTPLNDNRIGVTHTPSGKQGFLDLDGNEAVPCQYDEVGRFVLGRTMVRIDNFYGIVDTQNNPILPIEYTNTLRSGEKYIYHDSLALVEKDGRLGFVDLQGNAVTGLLFSRAYPFSNGLASVCLNGLWGYIDRRGNTFIPFIFDLASPFRHHRAQVTLNGQRHNIDPQGRCLSNCNGIISFRETKN